MAAPARTAMATSRPRAPLNVRAVAAAPRQSRAAPPNPAPRHPTKAAMVAGPIAAERWPIPEAPATKTFLDNLLGLLTGRAEEEEQWKKDFWWAAEACHEEGRHKSHGWVHSGIAERMAQEGK